MASTLFVVHGPFDTYIQGVFSPVLLRKEWTQHQERCRAANRNRTLLFRILYKSSSQMITAGANLALSTRTNDVSTAVLTALER
jgi:hypothetical protein